MTPGLFEPRSQLPTSFSLWFAQTTSAAVGAPFVVRPREGNPVNVPQGGAQSEPPQQFSVHREPGGQSALVTQAGTVVQK
jgi:hypothetical protein